MSELGARTTESNLGWRLLAAGLAGDPERPALLYEERAITYPQLEGSVRRTTALLRACGVAGEDRVALLFPNHPAFVVALLATLRAGAVAVPLNIRSGLQALRHVLADARPAIVLAHELLLPLARTVGLTASTRTLTTGECSGWRDVAGACLPAVGEADGEIEPVAPDAVALQPYTSGSTGRPKGCLLTHGGQLWNAEATRRAWDLGCEERALVAAPLYHKNAMICVLKPCLLAGATVAIASDPAPRTIPLELARHRCTYVTGVPATYELLLASGEHRRHDLDALRFVVCGSAPLGPDLVARIERELRAPVLECYGLTEGGPLVLANRLGEERLPGSAGRPLDGIEIAIAPSDTPADGPGPVDVGAGRIGELWVRNPGVMRGYAGLPEQTAARLTDEGWLRTGDLCRRDAAGDVEVLGRRDEMMSVAGENVYPAEVERLLREAAGVSQAAVVPVSHPLKGQVPVAFVVPSTPSADATPPDETQLKRHCIEHGAPYAHPRRVWLVDELPLAGTGKVDKRALAQLAATRLEDER